jgi:hypothetical protein
MGVRRSQVSKHFFFEKKKQKTFVTPGQRGKHRPRHTQTPGEQKFFGSFFQKRTSSFEPTLR